MLAPDTPCPSLRRPSPMSTMIERTYTVEGMTCSHCELSVCKEVKKLNGVDSVQADRTTGRLVVRGEAIDADAVRQAVEGAGYRLASQRAPQAPTSVPTT